MQQFGNELLKVNSHQSLLPDVKIKRSLFPYNVISRLQTQIHGVVHPIYCDWVDPMTEKEIVCGAQVLADVQHRQVFDQIYDDVYWFYVPIRLIEEDWANILAGKNVENPYSANTYGFKQFKFFNLTKIAVKTNFLLDYLGWKIADPELIDEAGEGETQYNETITAYPLLAFWKIYDEYFRDEKFDESKFQRALGLVNDSNSELTPNGIDLEFVSDAGTDDLLMCPLSNKFHDYFTDSFDNPGDSEYSSIGISPDTAPVGTIAPTSSSAPSGNITLAGAAVSDGDFANAIVSSGSFSGEKVVADLSDVSFTLQQLRLSLALSSMAITQQKFGSRYEELMYGQYGASLPERIVRPVYLGGSRQSLANTPAIDSTGANLGFARGTSLSHLTNLGFSKTLFQEHGLVIGVSVTRISHSYNQGKNRKVWDLKTREDLPLRQFMNLGQMVQKNSEIYNDPTDGKNDEAFGYVDSYQWEREHYSSVAGAFSFSNPGTGDTTYDDLVKRMSYQDIYVERPVLSKEWLKEDPSNVMRTMTGVSIPGAGTYEDSYEYTGKQNPSFIFKYYFKETEIKAIPVHPNIDTLTSRW